METTIKLLKYQLCSGEIFQIPPYEVVYWVKKTENDPNVKTFCLYSPDFISKEDVEQFKFQNTNVTMHIVYNYIDGEPLELSESSGFVQTKEEELDCGETVDLI